MSSLLPDPTASLLDRIKTSMVGLKMPRAIEVVDICVSRLDRGEITALELVEQLLLEELTFREDRRIRTALRMGRLNTVKTLTGYDFSFQPSLDKARILALAELNFVARCEVVHLLGPPGTGKSHLASALGLEAVKAGKSVSFITLADLIGALAKAERGARCVRGSASTAGLLCSSSMRSDTSRSYPAAVTCSSSWSMRATKKER